LTISLPAAVTMWFAILLMVLAAAGNNIGKALQKQATRTLPRLTIKKDILLQYLRSRVWLTGLIADVGGAVLQIVAFALAPVRGPNCNALAALRLLLLFLSISSYHVTMNSSFLFQNVHCGAIHSVPNCAL
jgi:hypothetical protein